MDITRRHLLGGLVAGATASTLLHASETSATIKSGKGIVPVHENDEFYKNGKFDAEVAKNAYYEMMNLYKYPIPDRLRSADFWTLDFALGKFSEVGMAGIFWVNNEKDNYFGHEIFLLPGQMIPEHKHVKTNFAAKMEGWHVRHGWIYTFGEGTPTPGAEEHIPSSHRKIANARVEKKLMPGEVGTLGGVEQWHFMVAGPQGAIVSEYATYHDGAGLRFSHPEVKMG